MKTKTIFRLPYSKKRVSSLAIYGWIGSILMPMVTIVLIYTNLNHWDDFCWYIIKIPAALWLVKILKKSGMSIYEDTDDSSIFFFMSPLSFIKTSINEAKKQVELLYGQKLDVDCKLSGCQKTVAELAVSYTNTGKYIRSSISLGINLVANCKSKDELGSVIMHEYAHYVHKDYRFGLSSFISLVLLTALSPVFILPGMLYINFIKKKIEYAADHLSAEICGKTHMISALKTITEIVPQAGKEPEGIWEKSLFVVIYHLASTHPTIKKRIEFIEKI